jgi:uncharacterized protein (DUF1501 family)
MAQQPPSPAPADANERLVFHPQAGPRGDVLVTVFLRGGMDAVYAILPYADPAFHQQRHALGFASPDRGGLIVLDEMFGLHRDFARLEPLYHQRQLAIVQAVGLSEPLLSHFDATRAIERGVSGDGLEDGWIGRHLASSLSSMPAALRAVALGTMMSPVLRGSDARALDSLADFRLDLPTDWKPGFLPALAKLYARGSDLAAVAGRGTLATLASLEQLTKSPYQPERAAEYPRDLFGKHIQQVAQLIKAEVGLEAAVLSMHGWDSHIAQADRLMGPMRSLARGLQAISLDLGDRMDRVTVVVMSEFGRRIAPNLSQGTDHGRATAMLVLGGGIREGKVYGSWPGLAPDQLDKQGNLPVTTDYRHVLAEIVARRLQNATPEKVFPDFQPTYLEFTA